MRFNPRWVALGALLLFVALVLFRFFTLEPTGSTPGIGQFSSNTQQTVGIFSTSRKNYASLKGLGGTPSAIGDSQKFEKIGSLTQVSEEFDSDKTAVDGLIRENSGIVQIERAQGLKGRRVLHLGIGVPPDRFDGFVEAARAIGRSVAIEIVKNDKTNEYLQLKARRATLEKARSALEEFRASGGSVDERVNVQNRLTEIEQQIQELGVSLGDFDTENELCTVRLTLREVAKARPMSMARRLLLSLEWATTTYLMLALGFFAIMAASWIAMIVLREGTKLLSAPNKS